MIPQIALTTWQATRIAAGHPMLCLDSDGNSVCVRLATASELLDGNAKLVAAFPDGGGPDQLTLAQAVRLTTPIGGSS